MAQEIAKLTLEMPRELHGAAKELAKMSGVSLKDYINASVRDVVGKRRRVVIAFENPVDDIPQAANFCKRAPDTEESGS